jgi:pimeloyl-ACP methyl ester carboxylesterase
VADHTGIDATSMGERARTWLEAGAWFDWTPTEPMRHTERLRIFHRELGDPDAPVLLLVHGFPTSSIDWFDVVEPLSQHHRVCLLDFPGFGFSDKPADEDYTITRDAALLDHYLREVVGAQGLAVVAHDRGDSVALALLARCEDGSSSFDITDLVLSNGNMFLPLSNLTNFQRQALDATSWPAVREVVTPELLAAGMGQTTFTPARGLDDPAIRALVDTFATHDGVAVLHDTIQYLVQRSEHETDWLETLARSPVPVTLTWGLHDTVSPLRVASYVWLSYLARKPGANTFWVLPQANHYLQHDQPEAFVTVIDAVLADHATGVEPGALSAEPFAPVFVDRSRAALRSAKDALTGAEGPTAPR